jgi:hypothetical protein
MENRNQHKNETAPTDSIGKENSFPDTERELSAKDAAKVNKALRGEGQKMDTVHPDDLKETENDRNIEQERSND